MRRYSALLLTLAACGGAERTFAELAIDDGGTEETPVIRAESSAEVLADPPHDASFETLNVAADVADVADVETHDDAPPPLVCVTMMGFDCSGPWPVPCCTSNPCTCCTRACQ